MEYKKISSDKNFALIVLDSLDQGSHTLKFAANHTRQTGMSVAVLKVINGDQIPFMPWGAVTETIESCERHEAFDTLDYVIAKLEDYGADAEPLLFNGHDIDVIEDILKEFSKGLTPDLK